MDDIDHAIRLAEQQWPGIEFHRKNAHEASAPCPLCRQAVQDGFLVFADGGYWCRKCDQSGRLDQDTNHRLTEAEITEIRLRRLERRQEEQERRLSALERLNRSKVHERYHDNLDEGAYEWWAAKGVECWAIQDYKLGYCPRCPTDTAHRPSYTIPLWDQEKRLLWNLRHRLAHAENGDKYRPEMPGLGTCLAFPHHLIGAEMGIILEGAIKALVCAQHGFPTVGILGKRGRFKVGWLDLFPAGKPIYVALDPDAQESAERLARGIAKTGKETHVVEFPAKPDDLLTEGCTPDEWLAYVKLARRVH